MGLFVAEIVDDYKLILSIHSKCCELSYFPSQSTFRLLTTTMRNHSTSLTGVCLGLALLLFPAILLAQKSDAILQAFYWNTHPGDVSDPINGGIWWDSLTAVAPELAASGFSTIWTPPMTKGFGGIWDMGYGLYDYYDLGEYDQKFTTRTRHGNRAQLDAMIQAMHNQGLNVMADVVLNHRGAGDGQQAYEVSWTYPGGDLPYTIFNPLSGRFPGIPGHFHPNSTHGDQNGDYRTPIFFEDICYFNQIDTASPPGGWYHEAPPFGLGHAGDSLISWGRWLVDEVGFDEMRLDAVKHIDDAFLAKFLVETRDGDQPFAVGEFFDSNGATLNNYRNLVESSINGGDKYAQMSIFDFDLRDDLKSILDNTSGSSDLYITLGYGGMVWGQSASGFDVVTFLDNHDKDRVGFVGGSTQTGGTCPAGEIKAGNTCLKLDGFSATDHNPIINDKEDMGYPLLMAAEGRPTVFWKDFYWFGLKEEITWLMALRASMATGGSSNSTLQNEDGDGGNNPAWDGSFGGNSNGGNMFAMQRWGLSSGSRDGMVLGLNDHPSDELGMYVNTPFSQKTLKDYSDGYMFVTVNSPLDSRTLIRAQPRDYSWWGLTGLYPTPPGEPAAAFGLDAQPGGQVQYLILDADDVANFQVNGRAIEEGDQVAVVNGLDEVCGIGRVGQSFGWKNGYDMLIEILGPFIDGTPNGMTAGESLKLVVFDASGGQYFEASTLNFLSNGSGGTFNALRPQTPNRSSSFSQPATTTQGSFAINGISRLSSFDANNLTTAFPVEWLNLNAVALEQRISLSWDVGSESANQGFEVQLERGLGNEFEAIGWVPSIGDHSTGHQYHFLTPELEPGIYRVQVLQRDLDGQTSLSPRVEVRIADPGFQVQTFPNPAGDRFSVNLYLEQPADLVLELSDGLGRSLGVQQAPNQSAGSHHYLWDASTLAPGMYILRVRNGRRSETVRIQKK